MFEFVLVGQKSEFPQGTGRVVDVAGTPVAVFNVAGSFHGIHNICIHQGAPLGEGILDGNQVTCPWHAWEYDVTTGVSTFNPRVRVARFEVKIEGDQVLVSSDPVRESS